MKYLTLTIYLFSQLCLASEWQSDPDQSELNYSVNFEQLPINGQFKAFSVSYIAQQKLRVVVDITSVDMGNSDINQAIRDIDWFDIKSHSQAIFFSDEIKAVGDTGFLAKGTLQLKGISKPVSVPFSWQPTAQPENSGEPADSASMIGKLTLSRSDFAIGSPEWSSGDQIGIDVDVSFAVKMLKHATE
jgi:polyisoprenoid-binding protein YceI